MIFCLKDGIVNVLILIDVVVCGIDIDNVDFVINFDLFYSVDIYLYCIGCIVCVGKKGLVIFLVEVYDYKLFGKIKCYIEELLKLCVIEGLELCIKVLKDGEVNIIMKKEKVCIKKCKEVKKEVVKVKVKVCYKDIKNIGKCRKLSGVKIEG